MKLESLSLNKYNCYWRIKLNVFSLGPLHLNDIDYISFGLSDCLLEMQVPNVSVGFNNLNETFTFEMLSGKQKLFCETDIPIVLLFGDIKGKVLLDITFKELAVVDSFFVAAFDKNGDLLEIQKIDGKPVSISSVLFAEWT